MIGKNGSKHTKQGYNNMKITMDKYLSEGKDIVFNSDEEANSFIDGVIADLKTIKKSKNQKIANIT